MPPSQQLPATPELPFLLLLVLLIVATLATADDDRSIFTWLDCPSRTSPSPTPAPPASKNDTFRANLLALLDALPAAVAPTGFASMSRGTGGDRAFTRGLCVADLAPSDCARCLDTAVKNATGSCSYGRRAGVWNDRCLLNYADTNTSTPDEESYSAFVYYVSTVPDKDGYMKTYNALMSTLPARAAYSSPRMFATGEASYAPPPNGTMYGLVQCMRDRGSPDCERCLQEAVKQIPKCCWGDKGGWVLAYNCYLRFDNESFYDPALDRQPPAAPPPSVPAAYSGDRRRGNKGTRDILAAALTLGIALAVALSLVVIFLQRRSRKAPPTPDNSSNEGVTSIEQVQIDLQVLKTATSNFSEENKVGQGGFGEVFKGKLQDGQEIAVKMLSNDSSQGFDELKNELVLATKLKHRNLVQLLGVCLQEKLLVVYEYMPNRSLDTILFDAEKRRHLDWRKRYMIICGVARGLLYLHEESRLKIIHRDLKPSNILLDEDMNPKISDFGLARAFWGDQSRDVTKRPAGTLGYMAPEYAYCGHVSTKSDIFSFGVIILEMVTGRRNNSALKDANSKNLLSYVWEKWRTRSVAEIVDASLGDQCPQIEMLNCIQIGLLCVQKKPTLRPDTSTVVLMLDSQSTLLQAPSRPAFVTRTSDDAWEGASGSTSVSTRSSINDNLSTAVSENDVTVTQLQPR